MKNAALSFIQSNLLKFLMFSGLFFVGSAVSVLLQPSTVQINGTIPDKVLPDGNYSLVLSFFDKPFGGNLLQQEKLENVALLGNKFETSYETSLFDRPLNAYSQVCVVQNEIDSLQNCTTDNNQSPTSCQREYTENGLVARYNDLFSTQINLDFDLKCSEVINPVVYTAISGKLDTNTSSGTTANVNENDLFNNEALNSKYNDLMASSVSVVQNPIVRSANDPAGAANVGIQNGNIVVNTGSGTNNSPTTTAPSTDFDNQKLSLSGNLLFISGGNSVDLSTLNLLVGSGAIADGSILNQDLADNSVSSSKIIDQSVQTEDIANNAITNDQIADKTINLNKLQDCSMDGQFIQFYTADPDGTGPLIAGWNCTLATGLVEVDGVIGNEVLNGTVGGGLVRSGSGTDSDPYTLGIAGSSITSSMLAANSVTSNAIQNGSVGFDKISPCSSSNQILSFNGVVWGCVDNFESDAVVGNEIANVITSSGLERIGAGTELSPYLVGIANGGVTNSKLANGSVDSTKILDGSINSADLANGSVTSTKIANGAITTQSLADGSITLNKLANCANPNDYLVFNGTVWTCAALPAETDAIVGNEIVDVKNDSGLIRDGSGTSIDPYTVGLKLSNTSNTSTTSSNSGLEITPNGLRMLGGCASGQVLKWNATSQNWECSSDVNTTYTAGAGLQLVGSEFSIQASGVTAGTYNNLTVDSLGRITIANNITYLTSEADAVIGNEVTDVIFGGGLRRDGSGTATDPYKLGIRNDCLNNQVLKFNGTEWACAIDSRVASFDASSGVLTITTGETFNLGSSFNITDGTNSRVINLPGDTVIFTAGTGLEASVDSASNTISYNLSNTGTAGTYNNVTTDAQGRVISGSNVSYLSSETDGVVGNEILDATTSQGLVRSGSGTTLDPYTLGISNGGVTGLMIASNSINSSKIVDGSISNVDIASDAITSDKILDGTVGSSDLASNSVDSTKIVNGSITSADFVSGAIDSTSILDGSISLVDLGSNSVDSTKIVDGSVNTADLANASVSLAKLTPCTNSGEILKYNGVSWTCGTDSNNTYTAGNGVTLTSGAFSINSPTCSGVTKLQWTGTAFVCTADVDTTNFNISSNGGTTQNISAGSTIDFTNGTGTTAVRSGSQISYNLSNTGTAGTYNNVTTDAQGRVISGSNVSYLSSETDGVVGNEILDATTSQGLVRSGSGTTLDPYTLGISNGGVTGLMIASNSINSSKIVDGSISNVDIASDAITSDKILDGTVGSSDLASNSVDSTKIVNGSITSADFVSGAIDSTSILDGSISLVDLGSNSVDSTKIVDGSVNTADLANASVSLAKLTPCTNSGEILKYNGVSWTCGTDSNNTYTAGNGVTLTSGAFSINSPTCSGVTKLQWTGTAFVCTADVDTTNFNISSNGGTTQNISAGSTIDFTNGTGTTAVRSGSQISYNLSNTGTAGTYNNVTTDAQGRVISGSNVSYLSSETDGVVGNEILDATTSQGLVRSGSGTTLDPYTLGISNGGVTGLMIASNSINSSKIVDGSISNVDIASDAITSDKILDGTVGSSDLASNSVDSTKIVNGSITSADFVSGAIDSTSILDGSISLVDLGSNSVDSTKIVDGSIVAADIANAGISFAKLADCVSVGDILKFNGTNWVCSSDSNNAYTAGDGITLTGSEFAINAPTCAEDQKLFWDGTAFTCVSTLKYLAESSGTPVTAPTASGLNAVAIGDGATANGNNSIVIGQSSTVDGVSSYILGDGSTITTDNSYSVGKDNAIDGSNSYIFGSSNYTDSADSNIFGSTNNIFISSALSVLGNGNFISNAVGGAIIGNDNSVGTTNNTYTFGSNLSNSIANSVQLGTQDSKKFVVEQNGNITFQGALKPAGSAGTTNQVLISRGSALTPIWGNVSSIFTETDGVVGNEILNVGTSTGLLRTGTGTAVNPYRVDIKACANNEVLKYNTTASTWDCGADSGVGSENDGVIGNEITNVGTSTGLVRTGTGSTVNPYIVDLKACTTGQILKYNSTTSAWECSTDNGVGSETDAVIGNEVTDATASQGLVRSGTGTDLDPYTLGIMSGGISLSMLANNSIDSTKIVDGSIVLADLAPNSIDSTKIVDGSVDNADLAFAAVNSSKIQDLSILAGDIADGAISRSKLANCSSAAQILKYYVTDPDGVGPLTAGWNCDADVVGITNEVDGIIGNEIANVGATTGLVRTGAGTTVSPYTVDLKACANNELLKYSTTTSTWTCGTDSNNTYTAGNGVTLTSGAFSINSPTCSGVTKLQWTGTAFVCTADVDTTNFNISSNGGTTQNISAGSTIDFTNGTGTTAVRSGSQISYNLSNTGTAGTYNNVTTDAQGRVISGSNVSYLSSETDGVVGNEILDATTSQGLVRSGSGTTLDPYTLGISNGGVTGLMIASNSINSSKIVDGSISNVDIASDAITSDKILDGTVGSSDLASNSVDSTKIVNGSITSADFVSGAIDSTSILDGSISLVDLGSNSVDSTKIVDGSVNTADLANASVSLAKLTPCTNSGEILKYNGVSWTCGTDSNNTYTAGNGVTLTSGAFSINSPTCSGVTKLQWTGTAFVCTADVDTTNFNISSNGGTTQNISAGSTIDFTNGTGTTAVRSGSQISYNLSNTGTAGTYNNVTTDAQGRVISGSNVSYLSSETDGVVGNEILDATASGGLTRSGAGTAVSPYTIGISTGGVTGLMIATSAVDSTKIADGAIALVDLGSNSVDSSKIVDATVSLADLASNSIDSTKIVDGSITSADFVSGAIDSTSILDGSISLVDLGSNSVDSTKIVDGSVNTADLANASVSLAKLTPCTNSGEILKYNGVSWTCGTDSNNTYTAGNGVTLTSGAFSINSPTCSGVTKLQWTGTAFVCTADVDTTNFNISSNGGTTQNISAGSTIDFTNGTGTTAVRSGSQISYNLSNTGTAGTYNNVTTDAQGRVISGSNVSYLSSETDGIVGNEILDATTSQGLVRAGSGTALDPYTIGIATGGVTNTKLATSAVDSAKIADGGIALVDLGSNSVDSTKIVNGSIAGADLANCSSSGQILKYYVTDPDAAGPLLAGWNCDTDSSSNSWSLNGNSGTSSATNFIGTTDLADLVFKTNNDEAFRVDAATGNILVNTASNPNNSKVAINADPNQYTGLDIKGNIDSYFQFNIQNLNTGASASSDIVATANNGTESSYYVNLGINGQAGATAPFTDANDAYLYSSDTTLNLAALGATSKIKFFTTGGVGAPALRAVIDETGKFGIGTGTPTETLDVNGTARIRSLSTSTQAQIVAVDSNGVLSKRAFPTAGTGLQFTADSFSLTNTGVTAGTYNNVIVDAQGRVTTGSNSAYITTETDGIVGNEVLNATAAGGLTRSGAGTAGNPYTLGISAGGITSAMLLDGTILTADIATGGVTSTNILDGTIVLSDLASGSVDSLKILDGSIVNADLANSSVTITSGAGLITGGAVALGGNVTLDIGAGDGITVNANDIAVDATTAGTTATTSSNSGIESTATGIRLLGGCSDTQVLRWSAGTAVWTCSTTGGISGIGTLDSQTKSANGAVISGNNLVLQTADASNAGLVSTGTQSFAGNKTLNNNLNVNGNTSLGDSNTDITTVTNLVNSGSSLNSATSISDLPLGGSIGTALTTVDVKTTFNINQTTASQTLTLPNPTDTTSGRIVYINNIGTSGFTIFGNRLDAGKTVQAMWNGSSWKQIGGEDSESQIEIVKNVDQTVTNSTTVVAIPEWTWNVKAGDTWAFVSYPLVGGPGDNPRTAPGGIRFNLALPAGSTNCQLASGEYSTSNKSSTNTCGAAIGNSVVASNTTAATTQFYGSFTAGATGTAQIQFAQNSSNNTGTTIRAYSYMVAYKVSGADLAEIYYNLDGKAVPGQIVELAGDGQSQVNLTNKVGSEKAIGIVSTDPGQVLGANDGRGKPVAVALTGRVPVKVTAKNGNIKAGDQVTSSDIEGVGMLATKSGRVVGKALTSFEPQNPQDQGEVVVFVEPGFWQAPVNFDLSSIFTSPSLSLNNLNTQEILGDNELASLGLTKTSSPDTTYSGFDQKIVDEILLGFKTQQDQIKELQTNFASVNEKLAGLDKLSTLTSDISSENVATATPSLSSSSDEINQSGLEMVSTGSKVENGLDLIKDLQVVSNFKDGQTLYSFNLLTSSSKLISKDEQNNSFVSLQDITPILVKSIQEQQKEIEALKADSANSSSTTSSDTSTGLSFDIETLKTSFLNSIQEVKDIILGIEKANAEQDAKIKNLETENSKLKAKLDGIESRLQELEK